jgi:hypothetical protein
MPAFQITVVNDQFTSTIAEELSDVKEARVSALKGALEMGIEQILAGKPLFGAHVTVSDSDVRQEFIVSIAMSPLKC